MSVAWLPDTTIRVKIQHYPNARFKKWQWEVTDGFSYGSVGWAWTEDKAARKAQISVDRILRRRERARSVVTQLREVAGTEYTP